MAEYLRKQEVVEAIHYDEEAEPGTYDDWGLCEVADHDGVAVAVPHIHSLAGIQHVEHGDWIIKCIHGDFRVCDNDSFALEYEEAE